jgi:DNA-binding MarR family transcriptional regulator
MMKVIDRNMVTQAREVARYLNEALGEQVDPTLWSGSKRLSPFLNEHYRFFEFRVLGTPCLLMVDSQAGERSPATVRKHVDLIKKKWDTDVVYVRPKITAYNRKRLIEQKVPFIVPGNQMYLPTLGLDLREHFKRIRAERPTLGPATQVLIIHTLLNQASDVLIPGELADRLGYSAMTMTRAFDELQTANLGEISMNGRERCLRLGQNKRNLWKQAEPLLRSPVTKRLFIHQVRLPATAIRAGLSALARFGMLAPPAHPVHALSREDWKSIRGRQKVIEVFVPDADTREIEVWSYRPGLFADGDRVDPLSLYLSLKDSRDERVEAALEEMMRMMPW